MTFPRRLRRGLVGLLATASATLLLTSATASPAQATYGSPLTVDVQLRSYNSSGYETLVGRLVGTVQFDDGNSHYRLSLIVCRQSSYTNPNVRVSVNGTVQHTFSPSDNTRRPESCGGGHGMSGVISGDYAYGGTVASLGLGISGVHFDGSTAKDVGGGAGFDNPYN